MPYTATVIKVMIASPSDVRPERSLAQTVIHEWNAIHSNDRRFVLLPLAWETHSSPAMGARAQEVINTQLVADSDLLVAIFWTRRGTPTGASPSGTVEEIEEHIKAGKPVMLYFSNQPVRLDSLDEEQYKALRAFKQSVLKRGLVEEYDSVQQFKETFSRQLAQTIIARFPPAQNGGAGGASSGSLPQTGSASPTARKRPSLEDRDLLSPLDADAEALLKEASRDRNGAVLAVQTMGGYSVDTNGKQFFGDGSPRDFAKARRILRELVALGLLEQRDQKGEVFSITDEGFRVVELFP